VAKSPESGMEFTSKDGKIFLGIFLYLLVITYMKCMSKVYFSRLKDAFFDILFSWVLMQSIFLGSYCHYRVLLYYAKGGGEKYAERRKNFVASM